MKNLNNKAFSLIEILLAAVIFVISVAGIFATLSAVRAPVANKENALTAAVFGKQVLETLRSQVNATTYYNSCANGAGTVASPCGDFSLSLGTHQVSTATLTSNGLSWPNEISGSLAGPNSNAVTYTVSCADGSGSYGNSNPCSSADIARKVDLNIIW